MVTFAQAQERAEEWINGDVPAYQHREVRVREFELGFVVWAEDRSEGPRSDGGAQRLVIARDSGEATLWPAVAVGEVIRRYEEEYGRPDAPADAVPAPAARVDLNQTSFLLSPPEWLQEAADKLGIADRRGPARATARPPPRVRGRGRVRAPWPVRRPGAVIPRFPVPRAECRGAGCPRRRRGCPRARVPGRRPVPVGRRHPPLPPVPRRGPGRTPTPTPVTTVRFRCPRPCSRRR